MSSIAWILASEYAAHPEAALGDTLITEPMGEWPGGVARVTEFHPDPAAPEIVMTVEGEGLGEIGVFEYERVGWLRGRELTEARAAPEEEKP